MAFECYYIYDFVSSLFKAKDNLDETVHIVNGRSYNVIVTKTIAEENIYIYEGKVIGKTLIDVDNYFNQNRLPIVMLKYVGYSIKASIALICLSKLMKSNR